MNHIKPPHHAQDKPYGPSAGKVKHPSVSSSELTTFGMGGKSGTYGPAARPDRRPVTTPDNFPKGYTCRKLNEMG
jgi:hypothetical protein